MSVTQSTIEEVLGSFHGITQPPPKKIEDKIAFLTQKLATADTGTREAIYLVATYCFDLARKLEYLTKVTRPFAGSIDPELAHDILEDTDAINAPGLSWQERATVAHTIMLRLYQENGDMQNQLLVEAANRAGEQP